jgi:hypothetical protein
MKRLKLGSALSMAALAVCGAIQVGTSAADQSTQSCAQLTDVYAASGAQLQACGLAYAPLSSTTTMPGGGLSYNYALPDGQTYSVIQPPSGFEPKTASAAEDAAYGVPPAPSPQSAGYANWQTLADGNYAPVQERPSLVVADQPISQPPTITGSSGSLNANTTWAGYSESGSGWTETQVAYIEPVLGVTHCSNPQVSFWSGIGDESNALGQTGTASGEDGGALHQVWYENLPSGAAFPGVTAPANDSVIDNVQYNGGNKWTYSVAIEGENHVYGGTGNYDGSITEAITERPDGAPLLNFESISMAANVGRGLTPMNPDTTWTMGGYATTGGISNGDFTISHDACGG